MYLATAREHPSAAAVRQEQQDVSLLVQSIRDLNDRQSQLFLLINMFLQQYDPPGLQALIDDDVAEAAAALAGTFETAARGLIYEFRPAALSADRLATALKPVIAEAGKHRGSSFDRDAGVVLRRIEEAARNARAVETANRRAYLDVVGRVLSRDAKGAGASPGDKGGDAGNDVPRLIVS